MRSERKSTVETWECVTLDLQAISWWVNSVVLLLCRGEGDCCWIKSFAGLILKSRSWLPSKNLHSCITLKWDKKKLRKKYHEARTEDILDILHWKIWRVHLNEQTLSFKLLLKWPWFARRDWRLVVTQWLNIYFRGFSSVHNVQVWIKFYVILISTQSSGVKSGLNQLPLKFLWHNYVQYCILCIQYNMLQAKSCSSWHWITLAMLLSVLLDKRPNSDNRVPKVSWCQATGKIKRKHWP